MFNSVCMWVHLCEKKKNRFGGNKKEETSKKNMKRMKIRENSGGWVRDMGSCD